MYQASSSRWWICSGGSVVRNATASTSANCSRESSAVTFIVKRPPSDHTERPSPRCSMYGLRCASGSLIYDRLLAGWLDNNRSAHRRVELADGRGASPDRFRGQRALQLTAFFTSAPIFASAAAFSSFSANATGHAPPSSRFAASLKPNVAYLLLNFCASWKKQTTLPSL